MKNEEHLMHLNIWIKRDEVVNEEVTLIFRTSIQSHVIYGIEDLLMYEQDKHRSSKSDDEVEHIVKDSSNSSKKTTIKRESTNQTNKDKCLNCHFLYI